MRISDWSSDVCSSDLPGPTQDPAAFESQGIDIAAQDFLVVKSGYHFKLSFAGIATPLMVETPGIARYRPGFFSWQRARVHPRSEEHTSELQSLMRSSYDVFCLEKKTAQPNKVRERMADEQHTQVCT